MKLTIVGSGDAFGSGGRLQTCFHVDPGAGHAPFLIDCGITALIGINNLGLDPNRVATIFVSHLHGDHFGGLVWWILHARFIANRKEKLTIIGPKGIEERVSLAGAALYPGALETPPDFPLEFLEFSETAPIEVSGVSASVTPVCHPSGAPSYALRLEVARKVISYTGDTEWVDGLIEMASGADLFISECFGFDEDLRYHLNWKTIVSKLPQLSARAILLTHMGPDMLEHIPKSADPRVSFAHDGLEIDL